MLEHEREVRKQDEKIRELEKRTRWSRVQQEQSDVNSSQSSFSSYRSSFNDFFDPRHGQTARPSDVDSLADWTQHMDINLNVVGPSKSMFILQAQLRRPLWVSRWADSGARSSS